MYTEPVSHFRHLYHSKAFTVVESLELVPSPKVDGEFTFLGNCLFMVRSQIHIKTNKMVQFSLFCFLNHLYNIFFLMS